MIKITAEHDMARLNETLKRYAEASGRDVDQTNIRKARDLGWTMSRLLGRVRYRKAWPDFYHRSAKGIGTRIRVASLSASAPKASKVGKPLNDHQRLIATEIGRRRKGSGLLAVSMRPIRRRYLRVGRDYQYDRSRELGALTLISKNDEEIRMDLRTPGIAAVNRRTNFIGMSLRQVMADTEIYLKTINDKTRRKILTRRAKTAFRRSWTLQARRNFG